MTFNKDKINKSVRISFLCITLALIVFILNKTEIISLKNNRTEVILTYPITQTTYPIHREAYTLLYNGSTRGAYWVYECLSKKDIEKNCSRKGMNFKEDPSLPEMVRSTLKDYKYSGFDRGHLCPASDRTHDCKTLQSTFYLSNIVPQLPEFNRKYWNYLEIFTRVLAEAYDKIHVFSIPLYLPRQEGDKKYVHYQVIGENNVAVPTHFAKIVFAENDIFCFILPHEKINDQTPLENFRVDLKDVEKASGIIFSVEIELDNKKDIEIYCERAKKLYKEKIESYKKKAD